MLETNILQDYARRARKAAPLVASATSNGRKAVLLTLSKQLREGTEDLLNQNEADVKEAELAGLDSAFVDRLLLNESRIRAMADDVEHIAELPDPVGEEFDTRTMPNGLEIRRCRVPLGVIGVIFESRPNVTIDVSALCIKSGNAVIMRGGKESRRSSTALADIVRRALHSQNLPADVVQIVSDSDRARVLEMIRMQGQIDLVVPRGGKNLIEFVRANATVPVVSGGIGVCHTYVHTDADLSKAVDIVHNAKTRRPSVCNALDTVLVHEAVAPAFFPMLAAQWAKVPVEMRCDARAYEILADAQCSGRWIAATPQDFGKEFLSLVAACKVVDDFDSAISHIEEYGSGHSEAIITEGYSAAREFTHRIDAAAVFVNASTQFTDGSQFGLGAEIGISTQKFHARGPIGLRELTSYKWIIFGDGQIRPL